jgi:hypothetical protein
MIMPGEFDSVANVGVNLRPWIDSNRSSEMWGIRAREGGEKRKGERRREEERRKERRIPLRRFHFRLRSSCVP